MTAVPSLRNVALFALALLFAGCSSGGGGGGGNALASVVQDLTLDPSGQTTVVTFQEAPGALTTANFEADGGQTPQTVTLNGASATIAWDARVTPSNGVRAIGSSDFSSAYTAVTTSDSSAPTFTITSATQIAGLGDDEIEIAFSGAHVVAELAEDPDNWTLRVNNVVLDLSGSTLTFDENTQTLSFVLGTDANLHAAFTLAASGVTSVADVMLATTAVVGAASGDAAAPSLLSVEQNLSEDEYGRVVDFTFDEAMDPVFATGLSHFGVALPEVATSVEQPSENVLRVTFSGPIVPGVDTVTLTSLVDAHGNALPNGPRAVTQPSPVANAFDGNPAATTVENSGGDTITVVTTQAFDPAVAVLPASWTLLVDGNPVDLSTQTIDYDFIAKTLTIELDFDMHNGDAFDLTGNAVLDVDGQTFSLNFAGTISGDASAPAVTLVTQNRSLDPTGRTLDVRFGEDVDAVESQDAANYTLGGGINVLGATRLAGLDVVRLTLDAPAVPGDVTLAVEDIEDLAGNAMAAPQAGIALISNDVTAPTTTGTGASAIEGALNDTVYVVFNDDMVETDVEDTANWAVEAPIGTPLSMTGATIDYDPVADRATLTFATGSSVALRRGDDFQVTLSNARDLGANPLAATPLDGFVGGDVNLPSLNVIHRTGNADQVSIRFSEPCGNLEDLYDATTNPTGTRYVLRDSGLLLRGYATAAVAVDDGLGVLVDFGIVVAPTDVIDVIGAEDLAGNPLFPVLAEPTLAEDASEPAIDALGSALVTVSGERNDTITVAFDRAMSPWELLDPANYAITDGVTPLDLSTAAFSFDGDRTVTIVLDGDANLQTGTGYDVTVADVRTAQGVQLAAPDTAVGIVAAGDAVAPTVAVGQVRLDPNDANSLMLQVDEALDLTASETAGTYDYDGGNLATTATRLGPRTVRATFAVPPVLGQSLEFSVTDLAGNASGSITRAITAADSSAPLVGGVSGVSVPDAGGDSVLVVFNEPIDASTNVDPLHFAVHNGGGFLDLTGATFAYDSTVLGVRILLPAGQELDPSSALTVTITGMRDHSGNTMPTPVVAGGSVSGDTTAPSLAEAFLALRADASGATVDVRFDEDVDTTFALDETNWTASGGQTVFSVEAITRDYVRVTLLAPLGAGQSLSLLAGLTDLAGNAAGPLSVVPLH